MFQGGELDSKSDCVKFDSLACCQPPKHPPYMTKDEAIIAAKTFRKDADELLQRMKEHKTFLALSPDFEVAEQKGEAIAQHTISIRDLESCIMRQGMALKYIGNPNPYPNSKDPSNTIVEPAADGLKM